MLSLNRVVKFLWIISLLLFLFGLLYGYYILPDTICYKFDSSGNPLEYTLRKNAFYAFAGICGIFNILLLALERLVLMVPNRFKLIPNKTYWLSSDETKSGVNFLISNWIYSFMAVINTCLLGAFYAFAKVNSNFQSNILQFYWVFKLILIVLIIWIIYLPVRLLISRLYIK